MRKVVIRDDQLGSLSSASARLTFILDQLLTAGFRFELVEHYLPAWTLARPWSVERDEANRSTIYYQGMRQHETDPHDTSRA